MLTLGPNYLRGFQTKDFLRYWKCLDRRGVLTPGQCFGGNRGQDCICCCIFPRGRGQADTYTDHHRFIDRSDRSHEIMISHTSQTQFSLIGCLVTNSYPMTIATSNFCSSSGLFMLTQLSIFFSKNACFFNFQMLPGSFQWHFWADRRQRHPGLGKCYHWPVATECANSVGHTQQNHQDLCFLSEKVFRATRVCRPMAGQSDC